MKMTKKMVSIFLAVVFLLSISVTVFADAQIGSLTIHNTNVGETYTLYKIFDLTFAPATEGSSDGSHAYTIADAFDGFFTDAKIGGFDGDTRDLKAVAYVESREDDLADFATELQQYITAQSVAATRVVAGEAATTVVSNLEYGYYLMVPTDTLAADGLSALFALDTVKPDAEINNKSQYPTIEKVIVEDGADVDSNNVAIGDNVDYKVTSSVPSLAGYASYTFYITDTFEAGLTFNDDVAIRLVSGTETKDLVEDADFTVSQSGQVVTITFTNFIQYKSTSWQGADIVVTYSALVNDSAVVGTEGNDNSVTLTYSSNPAVASETKTTTPEIVSSYITGITINKVDGSGNALAGAQFQLTGDKVNKVRVQGTEMQTQTESFTVNAYVDENGQLVLEGLSEGEYQIKELVAPNGYHLLAEPITVTITCSQPAEVVDGTEECVWSVEIVNPNDENVTPAVEDGIITLAITNQAGNELPFTGGMGTVLFTVAGIVLMAGAVIVFAIGRKKMVTK